MRKGNTPKVEYYGATAPKQHRTPKGRKGTHRVREEEARLNDKAETKRLRIPLVQQQNFIAALMRLRALCEYILGLFKHTQPTHTIAIYAGWETTD